MICRKHIISGKTGNFTIEGEDVELRESFCLVGSAVKKYDKDWHWTEQGQRSFKRCGFTNKDQNHVDQDGCQSWIIKVQDRENTDAFELGTGKHFLGKAYMAKQTNK